MKRIFSISMWAALAVYSLPSSASSDIALSNIQDVSTSVVDLFMSMSTLMGIVLLIAGLFGLYKASMDPAHSSSSAVAKIMAGVGITSMPAMFDIIGNTVGVESGSIDIDGSVIALMLGGLVAVGIIFGGALYFNYSWNKAKKIKEQNAFMQHWRHLWLSAIEEARFELDDIVLKAVVNNVDQEDAIKIRSWMNDQLNSLKSKVLVGDIYESDSDLALKGIKMPIRNAIKAMINKHKTVMANVYALVHPSIQKLDVLSKSMPDHFSESSLESIFNYEKILVNRSKAA